MQYPIALMSYNRPKYLRQVVDTLKQQTVKVEDANIYLFQDGHKNASGNEITEGALIDECVKIFAEAFPRGQVFRSHANLGVAHNFDRAERYIFSTTCHIGCMFFEDDLVLSPHYVSILQHLMEMAVEEPRVGYVAAYGDHRASLDTQMQSKNKLMLMRHKWGFGLTRRQWSMQAPLLEPYLEIISRSNYRERDAKAIRDYYKKLGFASPGTSQDAMKDVASAVLGVTKLMTFACFGKYVGVEGLHSNKQIYDAEGYDRTELFPSEIRDFEPITSQLIDECTAEGRRAALAALSTPT